MGDARRKKNAFLEQHPMCCFCGGYVPATTIDHIPSRAVFRNRIWPQGFSFPACDACNAGSREDERLFAFAARVSPAGYLNEKDRKEFRALSTAIEARRPNMIKDLLMSANEKRRLVSQGFPLSPGQAAGEIAALSFSPEWTSAIEDVLRKLGKAMHYMHTARVVPSAGHVDVFLYSSADVMMGKFNADDFPELPAGVRPSRDKLDLGDQFSYRYGVTDDALHSVFLCLFNGSMLAMLFPSCEPLES